MDSVKGFGAKEAGWVVLALVGFFVLSAGVDACSIHNGCVRQENGLEAQYSQNQNDYTSYWNKLKEMAQVPSMYEADLEKVYKSALAGRYGEGGSKAVVSFIAEHNPQLDSSMYTHIQQAIEAGRDHFEADQKELLDKRRVYENSLGEWPGSAFASSMGFPRVDLKKYDPVINDAAEAAFASKKAGPIEFGPPK